MQDKNAIVVIGYSGHAYVVSEILIEQGLNLDFYTDKKELILNPFGLTPIVITLAPRFLSNFGAAI